MYIKCILFIALCIFSNVSSAKRGSRSGGGVLKAPSSIRTAASLNRQSTRFGTSNTPRFAPSPRFQERERRINSYHEPKIASAPSLSSISSTPSFNSMHVPRPASAPPLSSFSSPSKDDSRIPPPPPMPQKSLFNTAPTKSGSEKFTPTKISETTLTSKTISPLNSPKKNMETSVSNSIITPSVIRPVRGAAVNRNTTNSKESWKNPQNTQNNIGKSSVSNNNFQLKNSTGQGFSTTGTFDSFPRRNSTGINKFPVLGVNNTKQLKLNSTSPSQFTPNKSGYNSTNVFKTNNSTNGLKVTTTVNTNNNSSIKNSTNSWNSATASRFPLVVPGNNTMKNFTLNSNGTKAMNGSSLSNNPNSLPTGTSKFPWEAGNSGNAVVNPQKIDPHFDNPAPKYDVGDAHRNPRQDVISDITKTVVKKIASRPKSAKSGVDSSSNVQNKNETEIIKKQATKSQQSQGKSSALPTKIFKASKILFVTTLISTLLLLKAI